MAGNSDWRLQGQEDYLRGITLVRRRYRATATNDHDHCELCWAKFMEADFPDIHREGYATPNGYRWICETCFRDFRERFGWNLLSEEDAGRPDPRVGISAASAAVGGPQSPAPTRVPW